MSHTIYNTDAIVLKRVGTGEADTTLWLLTDELGLIVAKAQGARKESAKMRVNLQLFSHARVSLVRGKYMWRVTGTEQSNSAESDSSELNAVTRATFARIADFVCKMTITDELNTAELFDTVLSARRGLITQEGADIELHTIAKLLMILGYIDISVLDKINNKEITNNELSVIVNSVIGYAL